MNSSRMHTDRSLTVFPYRERGLLPGGSPIFPSWRREPPDETPTHPWSARPLTSGNHQKFQIFFEFLSLLMDSLRYFHSDAESQTYQPIRKMKTFVTCLLVAMLCVVSIDASAETVFKVIARLLEEQEVGTAPESQKQFIGRSKGSKLFHIHVVFGTFLPKKYALQ